MRRLDHKRQLVEYFKKNLAKNYTADALKFALINQGYSRAAIETALQTANKELSEKAPVLKEKPIIKYELIDENNKAVPMSHVPFWKRFIAFFR